MDKLEKFKMEAYSVQKYIDTMTASFFEKLILISIVFIKLYCVPWNAGIRLINLPLQ